MKNVLTRKLADRLDTTLPEARKMISELFDIIRDELTADNNVHLELIGTLRSVNQAPRMARNPTLNTPVYVPAKKYVKFTMSEKLKAILN